MMTRRNSYLKVRRLHPVGPLFHPLTSTSPVPLSATVRAAPAAWSAVSCRSRFCSVVETLAYPITAMDVPTFSLSRAICRCETVRFWTGFETTMVRVEPQDPRHFSHDLKAAGRLSNGGSFGGTEFPPAAGVHGAGVLRAGRRPRLFSPPSDDAADDSLSGTGVLERAVSGKGQRGPVAKPGVHLVGRDGS